MSRPAAGSCRPNTWMRASAARRSGDRQWTRCSRLQSAGGSMSCFAGGSTASGGTSSTSLPCSTSCRHSGWGLIAGRGDRRYDTSREAPNAHPRGHRRVRALADSGAGGRRARPGESAGPEARTARTEDFARAVRLGPRTARARGSAASWDSPHHPSAGAGPNTLRIDPLISSTKGPLSRRAGMARIHYISDPSCQSESVLLKPESPSRCPRRAPKPPAVL